MNNKGYMFQLINSEPSSAPITKIQKTVPFMLCNFLPYLFRAKKRLDTPSTLSQRDKTSFVEMILQRLHIISFRLPSGLTKVTTILYINDNISDRYRKY